MEPEPKSFDKILKENLEAVFLPLSEKWLGFKILRSTPLPEKLQTTIEREPDFIRIVETEQQERFILHLEFQTTNDGDMVYRQAEYKAILQKKYKLTVRQFVIYIGIQKMNMPSQLPPEYQITGFEIKNVQDYHYERFANSTIPEEILLAILGDFHQVSPEMVIRKIVERLKTVSKSEAELKNTFGS